MNLLRRYIRIKLQENASFYEDYSKLVNDFGIEIDKNKNYVSMGKKEFGKKIKRLWNKYADHSWFSNNIDTIHFNEDPLALLGWPTRISKDEISCTMHLKDQEIKIPKLFGTIERFGSYGIMVKGRVTLAVNDMEFAYTGYRHEYDPSFGAKISKEEYLHKKVSSGINKLPQSGPNIFSDNYDVNIEHPYVFGAEDFIPSNTTHNEALVDNWKVVAIVAPKQQIMYAANNPNTTRPAGGIYDLMYRFKVPVIDENRKDYTDILS